MMGGYGPEMMKDRIARELSDMRNQVDYTIEFWCINALQGKIYDADLTTELVDYKLESSYPAHIINSDR